MRTRRRTGRTRRGVLSLGLAVVLAIGSVGFFAAEKIPRQPAVVTDAAGYLNVTGTSAFQFSPSIIDGLPTNATIHVNFTDASSTVHTFTILSYEGINFDNNTTDIGPVAYPTHFLANLNATSAPGYVTGTFTSPSAKGWYEFACTVSGHFQLGMRGFLAFGENVPAGLNPGGGSPGPGIDVYIIIGTIVSLTVVAIVLGFVVGRRRGAAFEMPPERTGYPEAPGPASERAASASDPYSPPR